MNIIKIYAPTIKASEEDSDKLFEELRKIKDRTQTNNDKIIVEGDFNAQNGKKEGGDKIMEPHNYGGRNEGEDKLIDYCFENNLEVNLKNIRENYGPG